MKIGILKTKVCIPKVVKKELTNFEQLQNRTSNLVPTIVFETGAASSRRKAFETIVGRTFFWQTPN
jgi:hypothetical protein